MDLGLSGKRALVLGASRGLGAAIAAALAAEGAHILAAARNPASIDASLFEPIAVDLADPVSVAALIEAVGAQGGVDILINNGGGPAPGPAKGQSTVNWTTTFATLAASLFAITDGVVDGMLERRGGRIITVGSSGIVQPIANLGLSNSIRGAVAGWSKTLANEVARHGVTVNVIVPGRIDTDRVRDIDSAWAKRTGESIAEVQNASKAEIPAGRYGDPKEFAAVAAFLASAQASYVTGSVLRVDGGLIKSI
jgi:3-oxoacyl-[acyl-carrier protein] reductase